MKLLEHEGKALLAKHGVPLPPGAIWPAVPESTGGWVVKAQVLAGGRGKRGGIRVAADRAELEAQAAALSGGRLGDEPIHAVWVEQKLEIAREYYLAALVDRDLGRVAVIASAEGGVDIEQVGREKIFRVDVDPLIGIAAFQVQQLRRSLGLEGELAKQFQALVLATVETLVEEDAELVEINPVIATTGGRLVAGDAKVLLDDDAVSRHPKRSSPVAWSSDSAFMQRCRELDVIGVDNRRRAPPPRRPSVSILGNGAGLTMATYDQVTLSGLDVAGAIELHGALARGVEHTANVFEAFFLLEADVLFVNAFYQLRSTDALANALVMALGRPGAPERNRVVCRMRGVNQQASRAILEQAGVFYSPSLREATEQVIALCRSLGTGAGNRA
jgi:succinyl-CoA synthetase beta subunit